MSNLLIQSIKKSVCDQLNFLLYAYSGVDVRESSSGTLFIFVIFPSNSFVTGFCIDQICKVTGSEFLGVDVNFDGSLSIEFCYESSQNN